jgi:hypothetical protein
MALDARDAARSFADAAEVTTWTGKPGTSINATGTVPTMDVDGLNGLPAVDFPGTTGQELTHTADVTGACTWIAALKTTGSLSGYRVIAAAGDNTSAGSMLNANTSSSKWGSYGSGDINANTALASGDVAILTLSDAAGTGSFFRNGAADGTFTDNTIGQAVKHIGGTGGQEVPMKLGAIVLFFSAVSAALRRRIEQSLAFSFRIPCA